MAVRPEINAKSELQFVSILIRESANRIAGTPLSFPGARRVHPSGNAQPYPRRYAEQRRCIHAASCRTIRPRFLRPAHRTCPRGSRRDNRPAFAPRPLSGPQIPPSRAAHRSPRRDSFRRRRRYPFRAAECTEKPPIFSNYSHIGKHLSLAAIKIQCYTV